MDDLSLLLGAAVAKRFEQLRDQEPTEQQEVLIGMAAAQVLEVAIGAPNAVGAVGDFLKAEEAWLA